MVSSKDKASSYQQDMPNLALFRSLVGTLPSKLKNINEATYSELPNAESEALEVLNKINMITGQVQLEVQALASKRRLEVR
jgi:hypothetical protein